MNRAEIEDKVMSIVIPLLAGTDIELVDVEYVQEREWYLRIFIDRAEGVGIEDCEQASRLMEPVLDEVNFLNQAYYLEVSSPGLTRPLKTRQDFVRSTGRLCRIITSEAVHDMNEFVGEILTVNDDTVEVKGKIDVFEVPFCAIKKAHLEFDF